MITSPPPPLMQLVADTVVTIPSRGALEMAADAAVVILALALAATFVALVLFLRRLAGLEREVRKATRRAADRAGPVLDRSRDVADNVEFITRAVRTDVERLNASVKALSDRLTQTSDRMEERIEDFNALMEVVQSEAESIFIDTAATVRGVRAGARSLGGDDGAEPAAGAELDRIGPGTDSRLQAPTTGASEATREERVATSWPHGAPKGEAEPAEAPAPPGAGNAYVTGPETPAREKSDEYRRKETESDATS